MTNSSFFDHFDTHFSTLSDPRFDRKKQHSLRDILLLTIVGVICGAESWTDIELFGNARRDDLKDVLLLPNGVPSHDTLGRVFSLLNPKQLETSFLSWINSLVTVSHGELIAIDGKTLRRSHNRRAGVNAIHMVSAWASENAVVLGQVKTDEKSNEINAIPQLLAKLNLKGCTVSIDAMGCQKAIAQQIRKQEGHYLLALKGNQSTLHDDVKLFIESELKKAISDKVFDYAESSNKGHGRIDNRKAWVTDQIEWLQERHPDWEGLHSIGMIESVRDIDDNVSTERRFYIGSGLANATEFLEATRRHWSIENQLHWVLDVSFNEDQCRVRLGHAAENLAVVRHIAINLLKQEPSKLSIRAKRRKAGWDHKFLCKILTANKF